MADRTDARLIRSDLHIAHEFMVQCHRITLVRCPHSILVLDVGILLLADVRSRPLLSGY